MPIYEYACGSCGHRFERKQRFSDEPIAVCPECGSSVRRVLHPAGVIFKGSGWYVTDSRKSGPSSDGGDKPSSADTTSAAKKEPTPAAADS